MIFEDVACTRCGCVCDDLSITVEKGRVVSAARACGLAERWFLDQGKNEPSAATLEARPAKFDDAIKRAAEILTHSRYPLIYGLSRSSTEGQRAAVRLADQIGATIDTTASRCHAPSIMAIQQVGESTCSLGEAKNRCDLVVFWGCDPVNSHPRHGERYSVDPVGMFLPQGRKDRFVIVVDRRRTESAKIADWFVQVEKDGDFEMIWSLRSLLHGSNLGNSPFSHSRRNTLRMRHCRRQVCLLGPRLSRRCVARDSSIPDSMSPDTPASNRRIPMSRMLSGPPSLSCTSVQPTDVEPRSRPMMYSCCSLIAMSRHLLDGNTWKRLTKSEIHHKIRAVYLSDGCRKL